MKGVSTRNVEGLVRALGLRGVNKSKAPRICRELDQLAVAFRQRQLDGDNPYIWFDALSGEVLQHHCVVNQAVVIASVVQRDGQRTVLGFEVNPARRKLSGQLPCIN